MSGDVIYTEEFWETNRFGGWKSRDLVKFETHKERHHDTFDHRICKFRDIWVGNTPMGVIGRYMAMRWEKIRRKGIMEFKTWLDTKEERFKLRIVQTVRLGKHDSRESRS